MLSIVVLLVSVLIIVVVVTLNGDVSPLYGQFPYNATGVSPSSAADPTRAFRMRTGRLRCPRRKMAIAGHSYLLDPNERWHVVNSVGGHWLRRAQIVYVSALRAFRSFGEMWTI